MDCAGEAISTNVATIRRSGHVHADRSNATKTKLRRPMGHWNLLGIGWLQRQVLCLKQNCIKRTPAIQSSDLELVKKSILGAL